MAYLSRNTNVEISAILFKHEIEAELVMGIYELL